MDPAPESTRRRPPLGLAACAAALVTGLTAGPARGQTPVSGQSPRVFTPLASLPGITGVTPWTFDDPDDGQVAVSIPFDFHFLGGTYTAINVGTNGLFTFGAEDASAYGNTAPGSASAPDLWIAPFWDDLRHPQADNVRSGLLGTAPNRILVVEAGPVPRYGSTTPVILYQAWLYEGASGRFDIQVDGSLAGASGTVGFEGPGGTPFGSPFGCSPDCDAATLAAMQGVAFTTLVPVDPELTGLFGALPRGALPGQSVVVPVTVQNLGQRAAATVSSALYLSLDDQRDATDTLVGTVVHGPVPAQGQLTRGATLTVPAATAIGDLRLLLFVDSNDAHPEVVESDNVVVAPAPFATGRDLVPTAITALGNGNPGDAISFDLTVASPALAVTGNVEIAVYASTDTLRDAADPLVLRQAVSFSGQPSEDFTLAGVLPSLAPGSYYPVAVVDSAAALTEIDEQNNVLAGAAPFLSGPDLSVLSVSAPSAAAPATDFLVDSELGSLAVPYSGVVTYRLLLSRDDRADAQDTILGDFTVTFAGEGSRADQTTVTMPAVAPGAYALLAVVDPAAAIAESSEANNVGVAPASISNAPDLRVESVVAGASSEPGVTLSLTGDLVIGGLPIAGPVSYRVSLSGDAVLDPGDAEAARGVVNVAGAGTTSFDASFTLPLSAPVGRRWAIVEIDPDGTIAETDETNNWSASAASIDIRGPDLTPLRISGPPIGYRGLAYPAQVTVRNAGRATARQFRYAVVLSDDAVIRSDDLTLFVSETATLAPNQSQTYAPELLLPAAAATGSKWLGVIVDPGSAIGEEDETNNARAAGAPFRLVPPIPDLAGAIIDTPTIAAAGEPLAITRTLRNEGVADSGAFSFVVVLSPDPQIDAGDVEIGRGMTALPAGGEEQAIERAAIPPDVPAGSYFVGLILDPEARIEEPRRDNNLILGPSLAVYASSIRFLVDRLPVATVGVPYEAGLFATGGPLPLVWSVSPALLPPGLTLDPASGILAGVATTEGTYELRVRVTAGSAFVERLFSLRVADPTVELAVGTPSLPPGMVGRSYGVTLVALGGLSPYRWGAIGTLPPGLALTAGGRLSGTPSAPGNFRLEVEVGDDTGSTARRSLALNVASAGQSLVIQQQALPPAIIGLEYCDPDPTSFTARGGLMPYRWSIEGDSVAGLSLSPDGRLCGVPTQVGEPAVLIRVEDQAGLFDTALFILEVRSGGALTILTSALPPARVGESYAAAIEVHGGTAPFQFSLADGAPPDGLALAASGELTGVPTAEGLSPFLVRVTDAQGRLDVRPLAIAVRGAPAGSTGGCGCRASGRSGAGAEAWLAALLALGLASCRRRRPALAAVLLIAASAAPGSIHAQAPVPGTPYTLRTASQPYPSLSTPSCSCPRPATTTKSPCRSPSLFASTMEW
ncbi:MAG: putative Ig domain-containing protein [Deltaproteobacteria bacterium]|nr:putative Ig domain-containing protein [Deltaproteobacteria bacterium]